MSPRRRRITVAALVSIVATLMLGAVQPLSAAAKDDDDVIERADITYRLSTSKRRVDVRAKVTVTNATGKYYMIEWGPLVVPSYARGFKVSGNGVHALVLPWLDSDVRGYKVEFPRIDPGERVTFTATWNLRAGDGGSANRTTFNDAYSHFCWSGQPVDSGSVTAIVPSSRFQATTGEPTRAIKKGRLTYIKARRTTDLVKFGACTNVYDDARAIRDEFQTPSGHDVVVQAFPGEEAWLSEVTAGIADSLVRLESFIGAPIPGRSPTVIREVAQVALGGYGGDFNEGSAGIRISERQPDPETLAHELAHSWFNDETLAVPWLWEGFAELGGQTAVGGRCADPGTYPGNGSPRLGKWPRVTGASTDTEKALLAYHYAAACAVMQHIADAVGTDGMRGIFGTILDGRSPYDRLSRAGIARASSWSATASSSKRTKPVDWRQWLDIVDEVGLAPTAGADPQLAEDLLLDYGIATTRSLDGRAEARAAFHDLQAMAPDEVTPAAVRRALDDWKFDDAQKLMRLATSVATRIHRSTDALAGDAQDLWSRYERARSSRELRALRDQIDVRNGTDASAFALSDGFTDTTRWWVGEDDGDAIAYDAGSLRIDITHAGYYWWTGHALDVPRTALAVHGSVGVDGTEGAAGWVCATADDTLLVGLIGPAGWQVAEATDESWVTLDAGLLPSDAVPAEPGARALAMDCSAAPDGSRVVLSIDGAEVADVLSTTQGPWTRVGPFARADSEVHARFDDLVVLGSKPTDAEKA